MGLFKADFRPGTGRGNGAHDKLIRVLQMVWLLQNDDCTVDELAERFGVSRRTIYRDLKLLDEAELPLVSQHPDKGYRVMPPRPGSFSRSALNPWP